MALIKICSGKRYLKEKTCSNDIGPKIDNLKLSAMNNNIQSLLQSLYHKIKHKSKKKETEYQPKSQEIARNCISKSFKKKIKSFNNKS